MAKTSWITMVIMPSGEVDIKHGQTEPKLPDIQKAVGGYIAPVDYGCPPGVRAYVDDEGICKGRPANPEASRLLNYPQLLFGTAHVSFKETSKRARAFFGV